MIDTAYGYGNEEGVGAGVRDGGVPRDEVFITTKLNGEWHGYDEAHEACHASAARLGVDYIDLYLIHWPLPSQDRYVDAWRGLIDLRGAGTVRAIGTSNFKPAHIDRLIAETGVPPEVNQVELNPIVSRAPTRSYHERLGIVTQSWSPLGLGVHRQLALQADPGETDRTDAHNLLNDPAIAHIAQRHGRTPAQIVLAWHLELGLTAVPKTTSPERMAENLDVFDVALTSDDVTAISALDHGEDAAIDSDHTGH